MNKVSGTSAQDDEFDDELATGRAGSGGVRFIREILARWYWLALGVILGGSLSIYYLSKVPRIHASSATLLVKQQTSGVLTRDTPGDIDMRTAEAMNTVAERLKRRSLLEKVAAREDVRALEKLIPEPVEWLPGWLAAWTGGRELPAATSAGVLPGPPKLAGFIASRMSVSIRRGTRLLDITFTHPSPEAAQVLADAVALEYIAEISLTRSSGRGTSIELLSAKSDEARQSLQAAQNAHSSYLRALESHAELEKKEQELEELARRYLPKHPKMITCAGQVEALQARFLADFDAAVKSGADQSYWEKSGGEWDPQSRTLEQRLDIARRTLLARTAVLKSEIQSQEMVFNSILTKMGETDVNQAATESEVEISSGASVSGAPVSPVASKVLMTGLAGGGAFGLLLAFIAVRLDNKFHTVADLELATGQQVLGAVSLLPQRPLARLIKAGAAREDETHARWSPAVLIRPALEETVFAEMIRVVRASVQLLGPEEERKATLFTSAIPGEGKTFISANFALACAKQGKRVLLMDLDLRKPSVHRMFGLERDVNPLGAHAYLTGQTALEAAITPVQPAPNLDLMLAGKMPENAGSLFLTGGLLQHVFDEVRAKYDLVVLDTSPLLAVPDARLIARHVDNICLVARADHTPRNAVLRAIGILEADRTSVAGVVFNAFQERRFSMGENHSYGHYRYASRGYGYGSYGGYGTYGTDEK